VEGLSVEIVARTGNCRIFRLNYAGDKIIQEFIINLHPVGITIDIVVLISSACSLTLPTLHICPPPALEANPIYKSHLVRVGI
jgi:hypothetical protein